MDSSTVLNSPWHSCQQSRSKVLHISSLYPSIFLEKCQTSIANFCVNDAWKKDFTFKRKCIGSPTQGLLGSTLAIHNHLILRAHPSSLRLKMPIPPNSTGLHTLPQATRQCPPLT